LLGKISGAVSRFELKYKLDYFAYHKIKSAIRPFVKNDIYTAVARDKMYFVRSLYFDTYDYLAYCQKASGDCERVKFRIRTYSPCIGKDAILKAEIKARKANIMEKYSTFISLDDYALFLKKRHWQTHEDAALIEFERYVHLKALSPQIAVEYYREGYASRNRDGLRITFDHKVQSAHASTLFPDRAFYRIHHPHMVILEIKYRGSAPHWVTDIVKSHGLKITANSKFAQGIQVARKDLHNPNNIVVVR
jgi:hypothetical protein